jgi:rhodanese-related sulfurtransferase
MERRRASITADLRLRAVVLMTLAVLVTTGCSSSLPTAGNVDNTVARTLIEKGVRVVDVRTTAEFEAGHLPEAENVPLDQLPTAMTTWDTSKPILVYCATGARSSEALSMLAGAGFTAVYNLTQGIVAWDGEVTSGPAGQVASTDAGAPSASGLPVMYEFYTDW